MRAHPQITASLLDFLCRVSLEKTNTCTCTVTDTKHPHNKYCVYSCTWRCTYTLQIFADYYPSGDQVVETGMKAALRDILQKGVLQSVDCYTKYPTFHNHIAKRLILYSGNFSHGAKFCGFC